MPDRLTEADLARWEAMKDERWTFQLARMEVVDKNGVWVASVGSESDGEDIAEARTAVPALVDEVRRLRDGYGSATECWCWDIAADRIRELEAENRMLRNTLDEVWSGVQEKRDT